MEQRAYIHQHQPKRQPTKKYKVTVKSRTLTKGEYLLYSMYGIILAAILFAGVHLSAQIDQLNRDIESVRMSITEQSTINDNLVYQQMEYSNPERILSIAKENGLNIQNTQVKQATSLD